MVYAVMMVIKLIYEMEGALAFVDEMCVSFLASMCFTEASQQRS